VHAGRDAETGADLQRPAVRVLPGVAEPEDQGPQVVGLELPEDVAGAQAAADPETMASDSGRPVEGSSIPRLASTPAMAWVSGWTPPVSW